MAARFWTGGTGIWDASNTGNWSTSSGGAPGASVPVSGDTVTFDGNSSGGVCTVNTNFTITSLTMGAYTGTIDFSAHNNSPTMQTFSGTGTATRTLNMGSGTWTITGTGAVFTMSTVTNLTFSAGTSTLAFTDTSSSSRTVALAVSTVFNVINVTGGTGAFTQAGVACKDFNFTGFSGSLSNNDISLTGSLTLGSGMTVASGATTITFNGSVGTQTITTNGVSIGRNITVNTTGSTVSLADNLTIDPARTFTITAGTFTANNKNLSVGAFASSNSNTRSITMGSGTWTLTAGNTTAWNTATTTGLTFNAGTSTIKITDTTTGGTVAFAGGGLTFNNLWWSRGTQTATNNTGGGSNTFNDFKDDGTAAHSLVFATGTTQTVSTFSVHGNPGALITINTNGATTTHALTKTGGGSVNGSYLNIQHSVASPANTWYAGTTSTNNQAVATAGSGWVFTDVPSTSTKPNGFFIMANPGIAQHS